MQVAQHRAAQLTIEVRNFDDALAAPTGNVAVVVTDVDGEQIASANAAASQTTGIFTYTLPSAVTENLGTYTVTATYTLAGYATTRTYPVETIGNYLFEIHELRAYNSDVTEARFSAAAVRLAREIATERLEKIAMVAFSPRQRRVLLSGTGTESIMVPDVYITDVVAATLWESQIGADDSDELTPTEVGDVVVDRDAGLLIRTDGDLWHEGTQNIEIDYVHGYEITPDPVKRATMILAVEQLVSSGTPARATSQATDIGDFRISVANMDLGRYTGIPDVDAVIDTFGRRRPRLG